MGWDGKSWFTKVKTPSHFASSSPSVILTIKLSSSSTRTRDRLKANDRVDPYVALYQCPSPSYIGTITHLRWIGFISPEFVQSVIEIGMYGFFVLYMPPSTYCSSSLLNPFHLLNSASIKTRLNSDTDISGKPFIAITSHAISASPVSYIPQSGGASTSPLEGPVHLPRADGEDTWCLVAACSGSDEEQTVDWSIVESVGQYDTRWG